MKRKNVIYPQNFFESEEIQEEDDYINNAETVKFDNEENDDQAKGNILNTEVAGSYNNRLITLRTEGDQLLNQDKSFFKSFTTKQTKLEIDYGGEGIKIHHDTSIESGLISRYYCEKLIVFDYALMIFAIWQIGASVIYYESDFNNKSQNATSFCLWLMLICSAFEIVITFIRYKTQIEFELSQKLISYIDDLMTTKKYKAMTFEFFILLLQPYPFLNNFYFETNDFIEELEFQFKWNWLLTIFGMLRVYIIFRVLLKSTSYLTPRASRISRMYGSQSGYAYAIKCLFQDYPIFLSLIAFIFSLFFFAYSIFICERPLMNVLPKNQQTFVFDSFQNSIWCVIITMATIGYGDFYPKTVLGRCIVTLLTIWGTFIVSVMVVVLNNALSMSNQECRALLLLKRLEARKELKRKAGLLLTGVVKYNNIEKEARKDGKILDKRYYIKKSIDLRDKTREFRDSHKNLKCMNEEDNLAEEMSREFDFVKQDVKVLHETQEKLSKYIEDNFDVNN